MVEINQRVNLKTPTKQALLLVGQLSLGFILLRYLRLEGMSNFSKSILSAGTWGGYYKLAHPEFFTQPELFANVGLTALATFTMFELAEGD
mgnify:CR=1 FL=1|jgi:hypothetical protein